MSFTSRSHARHEAPLLVVVLLSTLGMVAGCTRSPHADGVPPGSVLLGTGGSGSGTGGVGSFPGIDGGAGEAGQGPDPVGGAGGSSTIPSDGSVESLEPEPPGSTPGDGGVIETPPPVDVAGGETTPNPDAEPEPPPPPPPGPPNLARGRVAHWRLDETTGKTAADTCGIGNHGTGIGFVDSDWRVGQVKNGLNFTPARHTVLEVKTHETLQPAGMLSMSLWVRALSWSNRPRLVQKGNVDEQFGLGVEDGQLRFSVRLVGGRLAVVTAPAPALNKWVHVAALFDGWKAQLFVGGTLVATKEAIGYPQGTLQTLSIGGRAGASDVEHYYGMLDDIILYVRPLTPEEIKLASMGRSP
jgi:hypothetical protein